MLFFAVTFESQKIPYMHRNYIQYLALKFLQEKKICTDEKGYRFINILMCTKLKGYNYQI